MCWVKFISAVAYYLVGIGMCEILGCDVEATHTLLWYGLNLKRHKHSIRLCDKCFKASIKHLDSIGYKWKEKIMVMFT